MVRVKSLTLQALYLNESRVLVEEMEGFVITTNLKTL
jgi:hypothetical protein